MTTRITSPESLDGLLLIASQNNGEAPLLNVATPERLYLGYMLVGVFINGDFEIVGDDGDDLTRLSFNDCMVYAED